MSNPPYGVDYNPSQNVERENVGRFANPMMRNEPRGRDMLPSILVKQAPQLMDRTALLEEIAQARKELQITQQEVRLLSETMARRMSSMESRLQAGEASTRSLDRREVSASNSLLQLKTEMEVKMRDLVAEIQRSRRLFEQELQNQTDRIRREFEEKEEANGSAEAQAREAGRQCRAVEEKMRKMEEEMRAGLERRTQMVLDSLRKYELGNVEKFSALEQVVQLERNERKEEAAAVREELSEVMRAVKEELEKESDGVVRMESELRSELGTMQSMLQERTKSLREESDGARLRLEGMLREEVGCWKQEGEEMRRRMEGFAVLFERERRRQRELVQSSAGQMKEKVQAVQSMWKEMQQEGVRIRSLASQVQEETSMQVKMVTERMDEGMQALRGVQERQGEQLGDARQQQAKGMAELREKVSSSLVRVHSELEASLREERQTRQTILLRLEEHEGASQRMMQEQASFEEGVEQRLRHAMIRTSEDVQQLSGRMDAIYLDVQAQTDEQSKRLHALEVVNREKLADLSNDMHVANERQWEEILDIKKAVRALESQDRAKESSLSKQIQELRRRLAGLEQVSPIAINPQRDLNDEQLEDHREKLSQLEGDAVGEEERGYREDGEEEGSIKLADPEDEMLMGSESSMMLEGGETNVEHEEEGGEEMGQQQGNKDSSLVAEEEILDLEDEAMGQTGSGEDEVEEQFEHDADAGALSGEEGLEDATGAGKAEASVDVQQEGQESGRKEEGIQEEGGREEEEAARFRERERVREEEEKEMIQTAEEVSMQAVEQVVEDLSLSPAEQEGDRSSASGEERAEEVSAESSREEDSPAATGMEDGAVKRGEEGPGEGAAVEGNDGAGAGAGGGEKGAEDKPRQEAPPASGSAEEATVPAAGGGDGKPATPVAQDKEEDARDQVREHGVSAQAAEEDHQLEPLPQEEEHGETSREEVAAAAEEEGAEGSSVLAEDGERKETPASKTEGAGVLSSTPPGEGAAALQEDVGTEGEGMKAAVGAAEEKTERDEAARAGDEGGTGEREVS